MLIGDFNAKVGDHQISQAMGNHGLGDVNERGYRLIQFCENNQLTIANTLFEQPNRRKYTWMAPNGITRNQIDYIITRNRWKSNILNCRTFPGADCDTDHQLLIAKMRFRLKQIKKHTPPLRYDLERVPQAFGEDLNNRFQILSNLTEERSPDEIWTTIKDCVKETAKVHIPKLKRKKGKPWISTTTLDLVEQRRIEKTTSGFHSERYKNLSRQVKHQCISDKEQHLQNLCYQLECEANYGSSKSLFRTVKELNKKFAPKMGALKAANGSVLTDTDDIKRRWLEYTKKLYEYNEPDGTIVDLDNIQQEPPPLKDEIARALKQLKAGKAPGTDEIPIELLKHGGNETINIMHYLCCEIWKTGTWPQDWCSAMYLPIPKKGDLKMCENYRTLALIVHASKILLAVIRERLKKNSNNEISQEQAGFQKGRGTRDQIVNLRVLLEKFRDHNMPIYLCFIDYKKAFDCVQYHKLWQTMLKMGYPAHLVGLIERLYRNQRSAVMTEQGLTDWFSNGKGVRQGCILSPDLFNIYTELICRIAAEGNDGISIGEHALKTLRYADDTVIISDTPDKLQQQLNRLVATSEEYGLYLNVPKTKSMATGKAHINLNIHCKGEQIEQVDRFTYLGAKFTENCESEYDIRKRIAMGRDTLLRLKTIWSNRGITLRTKSRLLHALVWSIAMYGCEGWTLRKADICRLEAFEMWCYRRILGISYTEHRTNLWILEKMNSERVLMRMLINRRLKHLGHVLRMERSLEKDILTATINGSRSRGRQRMNWWDNVKEWLQMPINAICKLAQDRKKWHQRVSQVRNGYAT